MNHWTATLSFITRPVRILRGYRVSYLRPDLVAGLTVAVIMLPQVIAVAQVAELPPQMGLYAAVVGSIVGGLWGSSDHLQTGPNNTTALLVLSVLLAIASPGSPKYVAAAGVLTVWVGIFRLLMGVVRLGMLVNFVSDAVIVGFTAGAGLLISFNQLRQLLRLDIASTPRLSQTLIDVGNHIAETHWPSLALGVGTIAVIVLARRINRKLPGALIAMIGAAAMVALLRLDDKGVRVVGSLPRTLPPFAMPPITDLDLTASLLTGALAIAAIGLVEAMSIARSISALSGQRLNSNQEFFGQGLAAIAAGLFSGFSSSGSFTRTAVNYAAGAKTSVSSVFAGMIVLATMVALAPLAAYIPLSGLAGVLIATAYGLINHKEMMRIWRSVQGDRLIMIVTLLATLLLPLEFAVLTGILISLGYYLVQKSTPRVRTVLPDERYKHLIPRPEEPNCPQLAIVEILGDLYFGAVNHVETYVEHLLAANPEQRFLLLRLQSVEQCDISGIHAIESIARTYQTLGGDVYLTRVREPVWDVMTSSGFVDSLGKDHFLLQDNAVSYLFHRILDPAICIYECPLRVFRECQNLPKITYRANGDLHMPAALPETGVSGIGPRELWMALHGKNPPAVMDVREPREFKLGHIPQATSLPLPILLADRSAVPRDRPVVLVCRGGRRSSRAASLLTGEGHNNVTFLQGGTLAWDAAGLLSAVEEVWPSRSSDSNERPNHE